MPQQWKTVNKFICLSVVGVFLATSENESIHLTQRRLTGDGESSYNLPSSADAWCLPPKEPPLDYTQCNPDGVVNHIPFLAGLTNGLKMLLLGVISSFEDNRCFWVDESRNQLTKRDKPEDHLDSLLLRYFEPIGLPRNHSIVAKAKQEKRWKRQEWSTVWGNLVNLQKRRVFKRMSSIFNLGYTDVEGHDLKKLILQRLWRPLPHVRHEACSRMENMGLHQDYMAFSVRRGDKTLEHVVYTPLEKYTAAAERATEQFFDGVVPTIFVATDDCSVVPQFREQRPTWKFVSECDNVSKDFQGLNGYHASSMRSWTKEETDAHYRKFFVEIFALSTAKYFIGVSHTNVSWWVFFMRPNRWSYELIDRDLPTHTVIDYW